MKISYNKLIILFVYSLFLNGFSIAIIYLSGKLVDTLFSSQTIEKILLLILAMFFISLFSKIFKYLYDITQNTFLMNTKVKFLELVIKNMITHDLIYLENQDKIELSNSIEDSFTIIYNFSVYILMDFIPFIIKYIFIVIIIFNINPLLMIYIISINIITSILVYLFREKISLLDNELFKKSINYNSVFTNIFVNIEKIKIMFNPKTYLNIFDKEKNNVSFQLNRNLKFKLLLEIIFNIIKYSFSTVILILIYQLVLVNKISIGDIVIIYGYISITESFSDELNALMYGYIETKNSYKRILEKLNYHENKNFIIQSIVENKISITVTDLNFNFNEKTLLKKINYCFKHGNKYIITGSNGAGKTTFIKLILGLYCNNGLNFNHLNYDMLDMNYVRNNCFAYAPQDAIIFPGTFYDNIVHYHKECDDIDTIINDFNISHLKYKSFNFENIDCLSVGEKQKISLVRVLVSNHDILIFDEPFNSLDKHSKKMFENYINKIDNKLIIIISHDFIQIKNSIYFNIGGE